MNQPEQPIRISLDMVIEIDAEAWEHLYDGQHPLTPGNALGHIMQMFEADARGTGVTKVTSLETEDLATGEPVNEDEDA